MQKHPLFVVPVDFSREMEIGVAATLALAKRRGAEVHLLEVARNSGPSFLDDTSVRLDYRASSGNDWSRLEEAMHAAKRGGIRVRAVTFRGEATEVIAAYAQLRKATLLVVGQHYGTPRWRRNATLVSSLCRSAPAPVLVLPPQLRSAQGKSLTVSHVVSAVDFTVASAVTVRTVADLIRRTGARLTLVHALQDVPRHMVFSGGEALRVTRNLQVQAAHVAERLRSKAPADIRVRVEARVTTGAPHRGILDIASDVDADLIVMGVPPRSRLDEVLFGSTLRNVLRRAKIPVLVLPVPAGAYKWLEEMDGEEVALSASSVGRAKRLHGTGRS